MLKILLLLLDLWVRTFVTVMKILFNFYDHSLSCLDDRSQIGVDSNTFGNTKKVNGHNLHCIAACYR